MNWIKRNDLLIFLTLAFGLSWWPWPLHLLNPESTPMIPWGSFFAVFIVLGLSEQKGISGFIKRNPLLSRKWIMKIVVLGASGVLGRNVIPRLVEEKHQVRAVVRHAEQIPFLIVQKAMKKNNVSKLSNDVECHLFGAFFDNGQMYLIG